MSNRPKVRVKHYNWKSSDGSMTPGIGINQRGRTIAHFTAAEARSLADHLHDLADQLEKE